MLKGVGSPVLALLLLSPSAVAFISSSNGGAAPFANLTFLTDPRARCMDGTLSGYYHLKSSSSAASTRWTIFLQGGGECTTQAACIDELKGPLGSSRYFPSAVDFSTNAFFGDADSGNNPALFDAHHVDVPYCSGDLHSGTQTAPNSWGLYFSGHLVLDAILTQLDGAGLRDATDIVFFGASAGGIGTWLNLDWVAARYPRARVVGAPVAGFYFYANAPYTGPGAVPNKLANFSTEGIAEAYALWGSFVDADCAEALAANPSACLLANYSFPYITSEVFVTEAQTDQVVLEAHDDFPGKVPYPVGSPQEAYMALWAANMTSALAPLMAPANARNGVFNPACYIHTSFDPALPRIGGLSYIQAFTNWYTGAGASKLMDHCAAGTVMCGVCK
jgi:hypothetical protein